MFCLLSWSARQTDWNFLKIKSEKLKAWHKKKTGWLSDKFVCINVEFFPPTLRPNEPLEYMICIPAHGAVIGGWFGAWPMPLDWERPWQVLFFLQFLYYLILPVTLLETAACLSKDIGHFLPNEHCLSIERLLCIL